MSVSVVRNLYFLISILFFCACSYNFGAVKRNIPGAYDRVAVPVFKNSTSEVGVEAYFTRSMIEEIERGHLAQVVDREDSQIVIEGEVTSVEYLPGVAVGQETVASLPRDTALIKEYRVIVRTAVNARRKSDQKIVWSGTFLGEQRYPAPLVGQESFNTVNALYNHSSRHQNIETMAKSMMAEAYSRMTENF